MSRELYESSQKGEADSGAEGLLGAFVQVLTRVRQEQAGVHGAHQRSDLFIDARDL